MNSLKGALWGNSSDAAPSPSRPDPSTNKPDEARAEDDTMAAAAQKEPEKPQQQQQPQEQEQQQQQQQKEERQPDQEQQHQGPTYQKYESLLKYGMVCPDPKAHKKDTKLQDQASSAALHKPHPERDSTKQDNILDSNNRLSSAGESKQLDVANAPFTNQITQ